MKKLILLSVLLITSSFVYAAQVYYDPYYSSDITGERRGTVRLNGEHYNVTERSNITGYTDMEIKNYDRTYRGTVDPSGYGTLKDNYGNTIKVSPY